MHEVIKDFDLSPLVRKFGERFVHIKEKNEQKDMKNFIYYNSVAAIPITRGEQRRRPGI
jgi:hypothetical protein